uniref:Uncharacterized protein n=1 Tax=Eutreptiella gymnastica TaxID=73025 RepID=A0A7S4CKG4_9EUGL
MENALEVPETNTICCLNPLPTHDGMAYMLRIWYPEMDHCFRVPKCASRHTSPIPSRSKSWKSAANVSISTLTKDVVQQSQWPQQMNVVIPVFLQMQSGSHPLCNACVAFGVHRAGIVMQMCGPKC